MSRRSLLERIRERFQVPITDLPKGYVEGRDSLLRTLTHKGVLDPGEVQSWISENTGHPILRPQDSESFCPEGLNEAYLQEHRVMCMGRRADPLIGMEWPFDIVLCDDIAERVGRDFSRAVLRSDDFKRPESPADDANQVESLLEDLGGIDNAEVEVVDSYDLLEEFSETTDEAPIIKLLNLILVQGCRQQASDIHIEPEESVSRVRFRIDGLLKEVMLPPKRFHNAIVSRIKIMSEMDIAEKRAPQDGRIKLRMRDQAIDLRVSTIPSIYGEKVVLRILREDSILLSIDDLGFAPDQSQTYRTLATRPYGIILVTGPTGSGKSTTLYSTLNFLNTKAKNIVTIEDPVEYQMENINQIQVNRKAGIDFVSGLKSILRQDPDIIMIGEMRDEETAAIAVKAALTGHLVLSSLHTNDATGAYSRLQDMKVAPYLLASAVAGVVAQRLVRMVCPNCKQVDDPDEESLRLIGLEPDHEYEFFKGAGCSQCNGIGYRGRKGIYELLTPTREVKRMLLSGELEEGVEIPGFRRMVDYGRDAALSGITTVEEVCRVVRVNEVM